LKVRHAEPKLTLEWEGARRRISLKENSKGRRSDPKLLELKTLIRRQRDEIDQLKAEEKNNRSGSGSDGLFRPKANTVTESNWETALSENSSMSSTSFLS
jgi:hypothetical protein